MTIEKSRYPGEYEIHCDECGYTEDIEGEGYGDVYSQAKADGWIASKVGERWVHVCADCVAKFAWGPDIPAPWEIER